MSAPTIDATAPASARPASEPVLPPIKWHAPIAYGVGRAARPASCSAARTEPASDSTFAVSTPSDFIQFTPFSVPSKLTAIVLCLAALALAGVLVLRDAPAARRPVPGCRSPTGSLMVFAFLVWAVAGKDSGLPLTGLLQGSLFLAIPLVFGALGGSALRAVRHHQHRDRGPAAGGRVPRGGRRHPDGQRVRGPDRRARSRVPSSACCWCCSRSSTWSTRSSSASCSTCWSSA